jgi:hypothetical protein
MSKMYPFLDIINCIYGVPLPFNIASASLLTIIFAKLSGEFLPLVRPMNYQNTVRKEKIEKNEYIFGISVFYLRTFKMFFNLTFDTKI